MIGCYVLGFLLLTLKAPRLKEDIWVAMLLKSYKLNIMWNSLKGEFLEEESSDWTDAIDRGGLVYITDFCYQLFYLLKQSLVKR